MKAMNSSLHHAHDRRQYLIGLAIAISGAILFSTKAIVAKLIYRYPVDAVTLIAFRMLFSLPVFAVIALWQARKGPRLSVADRWRLVGLGLVVQFMIHLVEFARKRATSVPLAATKGKKLQPQKGAEVAKK